MRPKKTLAEVLASVSEILFPHLIGEGHVGVGSRSSCGDTPLHVVARWGSVEEVALLIAGGADVNAVGEMGETPLHVALSDLSQPNDEIVRLLIRSGARLDFKSEFDQTPLEKAERMGPEYAEWLRDEDEKSR